MMLQKIIIALMLLLRFVWICYSFKKIDRSNYYNRYTRRIAYQERTRDKIYSFYGTLLVCEIYTIGFVLLKLSGIFEKLCEILDRLDCYIGEKIDILSKKTYDLFFKKYEPKESDGNR